MKKTPDPSPFLPNELQLLRVGDQLRSALAERIARRLVDPDLSATELLALASVSAEVFGCAPLDHPEEMLAQMLKPYHDKGSVWIDWEHEGLLHRWVSDAVTGSLLTRLHAFGVIQDADRAGAVTQRKRVMLDLMRSVGAPVADWRAYRAALEAWRRAVHAGADLSEFDGRRKGTVVSRLCLYRQQRHRPKLPLLALAPKYDTSPKEGADALTRALRRALRDAQPASATGGESKGTLGPRKAELAAKVVALQEEYRFTPQGTVVLEMLEDLIRFGGPREPDLAVSTIEGYVRPLLQVLEALKARPFHEYSPARFVKTYRDILRRAGEHRDHCFAALQRFHARVEEVEDIPTLDWREVARGLPAHQVRGHGNLVHDHELEAADKLLTAAPGAPEDLRLLARFALRAMYDLGLRFGEVFRLKVQDVRITLGLLEVESSKWGETKTASSVRMLPLSLLATPALVALLHPVMARAKAMGAGPLAPLFARGGKKHALVQRSDISSLLNLALRMATGDASIRAHDLRHAAITRWHEWLASRHGEPGRWEAGLELRRELARIDPSLRGNWAKASLAGHAHTDTSAQVYTHGAEFRIARACNETLHALPPSLFPALLGIDAGAFRKRKQRASRNTVEVLNDFVKDELGKAPACDAWRELAPDTDPLPAIEMQLSDAPLTPSEAHRIAVAFHVHGRCNSALAWRFRRSEEGIERLLVKLREAIIDARLRPSYIQDKELAVLRCLAVRPAYTEEWNHRFDASLARASRKDSALVLKGAVERGKRVALYFRDDIEPTQAWIANLGFTPDELQVIPFESEQSEGRNGAQRNRTPVGYLRLKEGETSAAIYAALLHNTLHKWFTKENDHEQ